MMHETRNLIDALGGYREVARRLGKRPTTVHSHMQAGRLPASWYHAVCDLAREAQIDAPGRELFGFVEIQERGAA